MADLIATATADIEPRAVDVPSPDTSPVRRIDKERMRQLALRLGDIFDTYKRDRLFVEERWLRNQRQYLGIYDPEIEAQLTVDRSKAYPKLTRVKCISVLSRLMNLMFPGNETNWTLKASPSPDMKLEDVKKAIQKAQQKDQDAGVQDTKVDSDYVMAAVKTLADERAKTLSMLIEDQLEELGGDQTIDYVQLNRKTVASGIMYGLGILRGPFVTTAKSTVWALDSDGKTPVPKTRTIYKPMFEWMPVWDFYPDMSAKTLQKQDGYFTRVVMSRAQVRDLADRDDFFDDVIKTYLERHQDGNYTALNFEQQLRSMGVRINVGDKDKPTTNKYEIIVWHGPIEADILRDAGAEIAEDKLSEHIDSEVWMLDGNVIKCEMNPWRQLGLDVKTIHTFLFDEDDTSPVGQGLPNVIRDSQMSIAAAVRMLLDNASVICGPNVEVNLELLRPGQDTKSIYAYKVWEREGTGLDAQAPAVRNIQIDGHLQELIQIVELFQKFADSETFVGPATGGDMSKAPSEPMRTAAGASMLRGDAALPFKDIVRSFDSFTQSVIQSLVLFNKQFNAKLAPEGDYNVIARGATSLIAKEVRGMQVDQLATTQTDTEKMVIDQVKLAKARLEVRDLGDLILSDEDIKRAQKAQSDQAADQAAQAKKMAEAQLRSALSEAFKNVTQGQKNAAMGNAAEVKAALELLERALNDNLNGPDPAAQGAGSADPSAVPQPGADGAAGGDQAGADQSGADQGPPPVMSIGANAAPPGAGQGVPAAAG